MDWTRGSKPLVMEQEVRKSYKAFRHLLLGIRHGGATVGTQVFVLWSHQLFFEGVEILLQHSSIEIVGASSDHAEAHALIESLKPDIIIVEESDLDTPDVDKSLRILGTSSWNPRVIRINLHDNDLVVYHRENRVIKNVQELIALFHE